MNKKVETGLKIMIVLIITLTTGVLVWFSQKNGKIDNNQEVAFKKDTPLYARSEGWGPCPSKESTCNLDTYLYESGRLLFKGDTNFETKIDQADIEKIKDEIQKSGVMHKNCSGPIVLDYSVSYELNIDGKIKKIGREDTKCWDDLVKVNKLIDSYNKNTNHQGGS